MPLTAESPHCDMESRAAPPCCMQVAMEGIAQPDGLPVNYLCGKLRNRIWNKFVIAQKQSTGIAKKVCAWMCVLCVLCMLCVCVLCMCRVCV